jgi:protein SERAC1
MGTPHGGGNYQNLGEIMRRIVSAIGMDSNDKMLSTLRFESEELERSREEFTRLWRSRFRVKTFQEARGLKGIQGFNNKVRSVPYLTMEPS